MDSLSKAISLVPAGLLALCQGARSLPRQEYNNGFIFVPFVHFFVFVFAKMRHGPPFLDAVSNNSYCAFMELFI